MQGSEICECHGHIVLDGYDWKTALSRHRNGVDRAYVRKVLNDMKNAGITYYRDGGDRFGVNEYARSIAPEYGIKFACPLFAIHKKGLYGKMVGEEYETTADFRRLINELKKRKADFVKIMASGIISYDEYGVISDSGPQLNELRELIRTAHGEGFPVMLHCNGADNVKAASECGADSIEHSFFIDESTLKIMRDSGTVWVPTHSTTTVLRGSVEHPADVIERIIKAQAEMIRRAVELGVPVASGSDAGARNLPHGRAIELELEALSSALNGFDIKTVTEPGNSELMSRFSASN